MTPGNLKERIAALQQRATSPQNTPSVNQRPVAIISHSPSGKLRDRIAKFEEKGGVPVPRGSFGLGAQQAQEGHRKKTEFYGNRLPSMGLGPPPSSRKGLLEALGETSPRKRCMSTSELDYSELQGSRIPSLSSVASELDEEPCPPLPTPVTFDEPQMRVSQPGTVLRRQSIAGGSCTPDRTSRIFVSDANPSVKTGESASCQDAPSLKTDMDGVVPSHDSPEAQSQRSSIAFPTDDSLDMPEEPSSPPATTNHGTTDDTIENEDLDLLNEALASDDSVPAIASSDTSMSSCEYFLH